jgi:ABC-2 type transport system ATP-binding protein
MDEAEHCHRLAFIQRGEIMAVGSPVELRQTMMQGQIYEFDPSDTTRAIQELRRAVDDGRLQAGAVELYGSSVHVLWKGAGDAVQSIGKVLIQSDVEPGNIHRIEPSLEDVFITCMR